MNAARGVYRHAELRRLFHPRSLAVVGVSSNPATFGSRTVVNLRSYVGQLYLINPKYDRLGDHDCHASIASLPETPDCVLIAVPREGVEPIVLECVERGVGGVVIFAA